MRIKKLALSLILACLIACCAGALAQAYPESAHDYLVDCDDTQSYTWPGNADYLKITFSEETYVEPRWDQILIIQSDGRQLSYSGDELSGQTAVVAGNSFTITLHSDPSKVYYGYSITDITPATRAEYLNYMAAWPPSYTVVDGVITGYSGFAEELSIPSVIDGQAITAIGDEAFKSAEGLKRLVIPEGVTTIGVKAFFELTALESVSFPDSVVSIGMNAFYGCSSLSRINIPPSLTSLSYGAFHNTALTEVTLTDAVTDVGYYALPDNCAIVPSVSSNIARLLSEKWIGFRLSGQHFTMMYDYRGGRSDTLMVTAADGDIVTADIPEGVTAINAWAFAQKPRLTRVSLPSTLNTIEYSAFYGSDALGEIDIPDSVTSLGQYIVSLDTLVIIGRNSPVKTVITNASLDDKYVYIFRIRETGQTNVTLSGPSTVPEKVNEIVSAVIRPGMSDYEKALALHDYLTKHAIFGYGNHQQVASGVLLMGQGVCESYARAYKLLLDAVGIENALETGEEHIWNMVKLDDGQWYHVDVTWDDPVVQNVSSVKSGYEDYWYFGVSNYALEGVESHECYDQPHIATAYEYNYYYRNGRLDGRIAEVTASVNRYLAQGSMSFSFTPRTFDGRSASCHDHGIADRTALLAVMDSAFTVSGEPVSLAFSYNISTGLVTATASVIPPAVEPLEPDFILPAFLSVIDEEAFRGISASAVRIGEGVTSIGACAFADCVSLVQVEIPASVTSIDPTAFSGVSGLTIIGVAGSEAESFAGRMGFDFLAR